MHTSKHTLHHFVNAYIRFLSFQPVALQQHPQRQFSVATHGGNVEKTQLGRQIVYELELDELLRSRYEQ